VRSTKLTSLRRDSATLPLGSGEAHVALREGYRLGPLRRCLLTGTTPAMQREQMRKGALWHSPV
jgi:hypothetical protein